MKQNIEFGKRLISTAALCVVLALSVSLVGCGGDAKPVSESSAASVVSFASTQQETRPEAQDRASNSSQQAQTATSASSSSSSAQATVSSSSSSSAAQTEPSEGASSAAQGRNAAEVSGFVALSQYPELPNGCEITSLAAVLNYYDFDVSKTTLSDVHLNKAPVGQANFYQEFVGDPRDDDAYGCYSPVLVNAANSYLSSEGSSLRAVDVSGSSPDELYAYIDAGKPVVVWATRYLEPGHYSVTWNVRGQDLTWYTPEHCLVLVGYDKDQGIARLADPLVGDIVGYDMDLFETRYAELKNQAIVIE